MNEFNVKNDLNEVTAPWKEEKFEIRKIEIGNSNTKGKG